MNTTYIRIVLVRRSSRDEDERVPEQFVRTYPRLEHFIRRVHGKSTADFDFHLHYKDDCAAACRVKPVSYNSIVDTDRVDPRSEREDQESEAKDSNEKGNEWTFYACFIPRNTPRSTALPQMPQSDSGTVCIPPVQTLEQTQHPQVHEQTEQLEVTDEPLVTHERLRENNTAPRSSKDAPRDANGSSENRVRTESSQQQQKLGITRQWTRGFISKPLTKSDAKRPAIQLPDKQTSKRRRPNSPTPGHSSTPGKASLEVPLSAPTTNSADPSATLRESVHSDRTKASEGPSPNDLPLEATTNNQASPQMVGAREEATLLKGQKQRYEFLLSNKITRTKFLVGKVNLKTPPNDYKLPGSGRPHTVSMQYQRPRGRTQYQPVRRRIMHYVEPRDTEGKHVPLPMGMNPKIKLRNTEYFPEIKDWEHDQGALIQFCDWVMDGLQNELPFSEAVREEETESEVEGEEEFVEEGESDDNDNNDGDREEPERPSLTINLKTCTREAIEEPDLSSSEHEDGRTNAKAVRNTHKCQQCREDSALCSPCALRHNEHRCQRCVRYKHECIFPDGESENGTEIDTESPQTTCPKNKGKEKALDTGENLGHVVKREDSSGSLVSASNKSGERRASDGLRQTPIVIEDSEDDDNLEVWGPPGTPGACSSDVSKYAAAKCSPRLPSCSITPAADLLQPHVAPASERLQTICPHDGHDSSPKAAHVDRRSRRQDSAVMPSRTANSPSATEHRDPHPPAPGPNARPLLPAPPPAARPQAHQFAPPPPPPPPPPPRPRPDTPHRRAPAAPATSPPSSSFFSSFSWTGTISLHIHFHDETLPPPPQQRQQQQRTPQLFPPAHAAAPRRLDFARRDPAVPRAMTLAQLVPRLRGHIDDMLTNARGVSEQRAREVERARLVVGVRDGVAAQRVRVLVDECGEMVGGGDVAVGQLAGAGGAEGGLQLVVMMRKGAGEAWGRGESGGVDVAMRRRLEPTALGRGREW